jgi:hypothetical protein
MAHTRCMRDRQGYAHGRTRMHMPMRPVTHARTHARTRTHTHKYVILLFHSNNDSRTQLSVTLYVHCLSCYFNLPFTSRSSKRSIVCKDRRRNTWFEDRTSFHNKGLCSTNVTINILCAVRLMRTFVEAVESIYSQRSVALHICSDTYC